MCVFYFLAATSSHTNLGYTRYKYILAHILINTTRTSVSANPFAKSWSYLNTANQKKKLFYVKVTKSIIFTEMNIKFYSAFIFPSEVRVIEVTDNIKVSGVRLDAIAILIL